MAAALRLSVPADSVVRLVLLSFLLGTLSFPALAHTRLISSEPAAGAVLQASPKRIVLQFSAPPEKGYTEMAWSKEGFEDWQSLQTTQEGNRVQAALPGLSPGRYKIRWSVLSRDGHRQRGVLQFQIH